MTMRRDLKGKTREEQLQTLEALLIAKGFPREQAAMEAVDWLASLELSQKAVEPKGYGPKFTESEQWREIQRRVERLKSGKSELQKPIPPTG